MADYGISIQEAMNRWHLTQEQAEQLDKMDDNGDGKISGTIYDMAESYYNEAHIEENKNEANRSALFSGFISFVNETKAVMEMMKSGTLFADEETEEPEETKETKEPEVSSIKTKPIDTSKYDKDKAFSDKILSSDVDEVILGLSDKTPSGFKDKNTGEDISIVKAVMMYENFMKTHDREIESKEFPALFEAETGIKIENYERWRGLGGDRYTIGKWTCSPYTNNSEGVYERKLVNTETGETITTSTTNRWFNTAENTVPAANGYMFYIKEYKNNEGVKINFNYGDGENIAPTDAKVRTNGTYQTIRYEENKPDVDTNFYPFIENSKVVLPQNMGV